VSGLLRFVSGPLELLSGLSRFVSGPLEFVSQVLEAVTSRLQTGLEGAGFHGQFHIDFGISHVALRGKIKVKW
jgi:hypothetical protein